ncbi:hypothetical protein ES708_20136 [subsurface metagenome]
MQAVAKKVSGGAFTHLVLMSIFDKNGGAGKAKKLNVLKERSDALVRFSKLAAVALIKNENHPFIFKMLHAGLVAFFRDCIVQLLDGGNDEPGIIPELPYQ